MKRDQESEYYQTIVRSFLNRRGAPFFLTPREISLISYWEKNRFPLRIVLEGIRACFEHGRTRKQKGKGRTSLVMCEPFVSKSYDMCKERQVGSRVKKKSRVEQKRHAEKEVKFFLSSISPEMKYLEPPFVQALGLLNTQDCQEGVLDELEARVETLILTQAKKEARQVKSSIQNEFPSIQADELTRITRLRVIKGIRQKHKIPHISLFYY